ncbi:MAG: hypothetical protein DMF62_03595 [Acidobacteria bacterium]|nr:MAG: hypothetical protein DMF62_03595 [Acidobacteriota bacterium]
MSPEVREAFRELCLGIAEEINASPQGVPAGPLYMAFATKGFSLEQFEAIMGALVATKKISKSGHQYFPAKQK